MAYHYPYREGAHLHPDDCLETHPREEWYITQLLLFLHDFPAVIPVSECLHPEWALKALERFDEDRDRLSNRLQNVINAIIGNKP